MSTREQSNQSTYDETSSTKRICAGLGIGAMLVAPIAIVSLAIKNEQNDPACEMQPAAYMNAQLQDYQQEHCD